MHTEDSLSQADGNPSAKSAPVWKTRSPVPQLGGTKDTVASMGNLQL